MLPTLLTLGNAVCGFGAITILARVGPTFEITGVDPNQSSIIWDPSLQMVKAAQLIFLAMLFDALDGSAARLTNQTSEFGAMLDSLCDAVSFGVAPAFMMLKLTDPRHRLMETLDSGAVQSVAQSLGLTAPFDYGIDFLWAIAALFLACAILRLARFNVETDDDDSHEGFSGLPSPAAASVIASFPIGVMALKKRMVGDGSLWSQFGDFALPGLAVILPFLTLAVAVLMVSRIPYPHLFNQILRGNQGRKQLLQLVFTMALMFVIGGIAIPILVSWFAFTAPAQAIWKRYGPKKQMVKDPPPAA